MSICVACFHDVTVRDLKHLAPAAKERTIGFVCGLAEKLAVEGQGKGAAAFDGSKLGEMLKLVVCFLSEVVVRGEQIEQDAAESAAVAAAGNGGRKARKKPAAKKKKKKSRSRRSYEESDEDDEDEDDNDSDCMGGRRGGSKKSSSSSSSSFDWSDLRLRCTAAASAMLRQGDLDRMFAGGSPGQDAVDALCRAGSRILESPAAMKPGASTRQALFELFAVLVQRCPDTATPAVIAGLTEAMAAHEHVAEAAAALCGHLHAATGTRFTGELLMEVVRQIDTQSRLATGGGSASSQQAALKTLKPFGAFLAGLAELLPASVLGSLAVVQSAWDSPAYQMRVSMCAMYAHLIAHLVKEEAMATAASQQQQQQQQQEQPPPHADQASEEARTNTRDQLCDQLLERRHDKNSYARSAALQAWSDLVKKVAVPLTFHARVTQMAGQRLRDKSAHTRKSALRLLGDLIAHNPFGESLEPEHYEARRDATMTELQHIKDNFVNEDGDVEVDEDGEESKEGAEAKHEAAEAEKETSSNKGEGEGEGDDAATAEGHRVKLLAWARRVASQEATVKDQILPTVRYCQDALRFIVQLEAALEQARLLLNSETQTDLMEAVAFFKKARPFGLPAVEAGLHSMLALAWRDETAVLKCLVEAFADIYIFVPGSDQRRRQPAKDTALELAKLAAKATLNEALNLERLLDQAMKPKPAHLSSTAAANSAEKARLTPQVIKALWSMTRVAEQEQEQQAAGAKDGGAKEGEKEQERQEREALVLARAALRVLSMVAAPAPQLVAGGAAGAYLDVLLRVAFGPGSQARGDAEIVSYAATLLERLPGPVARSKLAAPGAAGAAAGGDGREDDDAEEEGTGSALEQWEKRVGRLVGAVQGFICGARPGSGAAARDTFWYAAAEHGINALFVHCLRPGPVCAGVLHTLSAPFREAMAASGGGGGAAAVHPGVLGRLFFVAGHVAIKLVVYGEKMAALGKKLRLAAAAADESAASKAKKKEQDEFGMAGCDDDAEVELFQAAAEDHMVNANLLALYAPLVREVAMDRSGRFRDSQLRESAVLSFCKFMCVSSKFCSEHLRHFFTILDAETQPRVRANMVICLGDFFARFPNEVEPWTGHFYGRLRDTNTVVRRNTLMVLTHLVLNSMVKVRGQVSEIAVCIVDPDASIAHLAKVFFTELSKRENNPIYNLLPDVIGVLSADKALAKRGDRGKFRTIVDFLCKFIKKDRQAEALVDKLCARLEAAHKVEQWRDFAFCLSKLANNEPCVRKLAELFKCYKEALGDAEVFKLFRGIAAKARKVAASGSGSSKTETKELVAEWDKKLAAAAGEEDDDEEQGDEDGEGKADSEDKEATADGSAGSIEKATGSEADAEKDKDDHETEDDDEEEEEEEEEEKPRKSRRGAAAKTSSSKKATTKATKASKSSKAGKTAGGRAKSTRGRRGAAAENANPN